MNIARRKNRVVTNHAPGEFANGVVCKDPGRRAGDAVARLIQAIQANLDREAQHGPVKVYTPAEIAAFETARGLR